MPRVTRRSIASKDEAPSEESTPARGASRGRKSAAKKEEPKVEEVPIGDPQSVAPKRGRQSAAAVKAEEPEVKPAAGRGRSASRGKSTTRGGGRKAKDEEEEEQDSEEQEDAVEPEEEPKGRGGRGKSASSRGRSSRGRGAKKEEEQEDEEKEEEAVEEVPKARGGRAKSAKKAEEVEAVSEEPATPARGRGGRSSSKAKPDTTPSPKIEEEAATKGRGGRGRSAKVEEKEEPAAPLKGRGSRSTSRSKPDATPSPRTGGRSSRRGRGAAEEEPTAGVEEESMSEDPIVEESNKTTENEVEAKQKTPVKEVEAKQKTPVKETESKQKTPVKETAVKKDCTPVKETKASQEKEIKAPTPSKKEESMETPAAEEEEVKPEVPVTDPTPATTEDGSVSKSEPMETEESPPAPVVAQAATPTKKRKMEEEESSTSSKRARTEGAVETGEDISDFVLINKEDVPAADSAEVQECASKLSAPAAESESKSAFAASEDSSSTTSSTTAPVVDPDAVVVPLTEVELTKQYSLTNKQDPDETSSTMVEIGSERDADTTNASVRSLDITDAASMDSSVTAEETSNLLPPPPATVADSETPAVPMNTTPAPPVTEASLPAPTPPSPHKQNSAAPSVSEQLTKDTLPVVPVLHNNGPSAEEQVNTVPPVNAANGANGASNGHGAVSEQAAQPAQQAPASPVKAPSSTPSSLSITKRKFIPNQSFPPELMDPAFCFSIVSYNILAECHRKIGDYSYTAEKHLELGYRHALTLKELDYLAGDVVCLQEVEPNYYKDILQPAMAERGFVGFFMKRTKEHMNEGEATFVKKSRFNVKSTECVSLKDLAFKEVDESGLSAEVSAAAKLHLDRPDVVLVTQLECVKTGKTVTVANVHVVHCPKPAPDVQCIQVACSIKQLVSQAGNDLNPHIICGDFNSYPDSAAYQLAKDGYLTDDNIRKLQAFESLSNEDGSSRSLIHHMWRAFQHTSSNLKSAYEVSMGKEPAGTSFVKNYAKCLDYVFFSSSSLDTVGVLETIDPSVPAQNGGLPSADIPSDHLSLKAVFRIK